MLCYRLLGEFLLPSSNILPLTCRGVHAIMKYIGMDYQTIDACPNDHIIYYGQHASKTECIYDEPLLEKTNKRLYEGSRENLLSTTLLLVNLKVMNNLSNTCMTQILRYVICFISYST